MYAKYAELRDAKNVRDADVAEATGVPQNTLSAWKNGKYTPKADKLIKIADYFGISLDELVREQEP